MAPLFSSVISLYQNQNSFLGLTGSALICTVACMNRWKKQHDNILSMVSNSNSDS